MLTRRTRRAKWFFVIVTAFLIVLFVFSMRRAVSWTSSTCKSELTLAEGTVYVGWRPPGWRIEDEKYPPRPGWSGLAEYAGTPSPVLWFEPVLMPRYLGFNIPLWMPVLIFGAPAVFLWIKDRAHMANVRLRFKKWLTPRRRQRVTIGRAVIGGFAHVIVVILFGYILSHFFSFFFSLSSGGIASQVIDAIGYVLMFALFGSPLLGVFWVWLVVRILNRWRLLFHEQGCSECGYDLTGNMSGVCPECGTNTMRGVVVANQKVES